MKLLFLCTSNSCRSQMAEAFARQAMPSADVFSAGVAPSLVHSRVIAAMAEVGVDLGAHYPKPPEETPWAELDLLVTMCSNARHQCPPLRARTQLVHWPVEDPAVATGEEWIVMETFRRVRNDIQRRVDELAASLRCLRATS
jgi:arsenate reductase